MYISDILAIKNLSPKIKDVLTQSLLNQAYLPVVVNSLVVMKQKKDVQKLCLNSSIYLLIQTFKILKETAPNFLKIITAALFSKDSLPEYLMDKIQDCEFKNDKSE